MLVLTRRMRESVVIGGADRPERLLKVTVLEIRGAKVRLGFEVDGAVPVHRGEVWQRLRDGGPAGSSTASDARGEPWTAEALGNGP
jgi:carbon storage regulator